MLARLLQVAVVVEASRIELELVPELVPAQRLELVVPAVPGGPEQQLVVELGWDLAVVAAVVLEEVLPWVQARSVLLYLMSEPETWHFEVSLALVIPFDPAAQAETLLVDGLGYFHVHSHDCLAILHAALLQDVAAEPPAVVEPPAAEPSFVAVGGAHELLLLLVAGPGADVIASSAAAAVANAVED